MAIAVEERRKINAREIEMGQCLETMRKLRSKAEDEKRALTAQETEEFKRMQAALDAHEQAIDEYNAIVEIEEKREKIRARLGELPPDVQRGMSTEGDGKTERAADKFEARARGLSLIPGPFSGDAYRAAFNRYIRGGHYNLSAEEQGVLRKAKESPQYRALQVDSDVKGGFLVASERLVGQILISMDNALPLRQLITLYTAAYGETLGEISLDGDVSDFEFGGGELSAAGEDNNVAFGKRELKVHPIKRKVIKVSKRLLSNPRFDVEALLQTRIGVAFARTLEKKYLTGTGAQEPLGLFTASADGIPTSRDEDVTVAEDNTMSDSLIALQDTLHEGYDNAARWLYHPDFHSLVRIIKDGEGRYLLEQALTAGARSLLLGKEVVKSRNCPNTFTSNLYCLVYGDFSYYHAADGVSTMTIQRLEELYAENGQMGFLVDNMGADGMPVFAEAFVRGAVA